MLKMWNNGAHEEHRLYWNGRLKGDIGRICKKAKNMRFPRNNQKFHFFVPKIKWIFWQGSRVPRHFKLTQLVYLCMKYNPWKFQVNGTIVEPSRRDFVEIGPYLALTAGNLNRIALVQINGNVERNLINYRNVMIQFFLPNMRN